MGSFFFVNLQQQWLPLILVAILVSEPPTCHSNKPYERNADEETSDYQGHIDGDWVSIEPSMGK